MQHVVVTLKNEWKEFLILNSELHIQAFFF